MLSLLAGVVPMLLILAFVGGFMMAGKFCKTGLGQFFMGILLGFGIVFVLAGVAFAGCCILMSGAKFD